MSESFRDFFKRRCRELQRSTEWAEISSMGVDDFAEMMQNEYYDCAEDPVPPRTPLAH